MCFLLIAMVMVSFAAHGSRGAITSTNFLGKHVYWLASNGALLRAVVTDVRGTIPELPSYPAEISDIKFEVRPDIDGTHPDNLPPVSSHEPHFNLEGHEYDGWAPPTVPRNDTKGGSWTEAGTRWRGNMKTGDSASLCPYRC